MKRTIISLVSLVPLAFAACGGTDSGDCTATGGTNKAQYVVNAVMVPSQSAHDYGTDLNGDGKIDNQLGSIIIALQGQGLNVQDGVTMAVADGSLVLLMAESSTDATFMTDSCATTTLELGAKPSGMPDFSGHGMFTAQAGQTPASFNGPISSSKFNSAPSATTQHEVVASVSLPLVAGQAPVPITLHGAHIVYTRSSGGMVMNGSLQGGIKKSDVDDHIVPAVANLLSSKLKNDMPQTSTDTTIESVFDTGGCTNPPAGMVDDPLMRAGMMAVKGDMIIDVCEVASNGLVQSLLAPDVQLFQNGAYAPNKDNTMKDSLSVGLGFTAVGAMF